MEYILNITDWNVNLYWHNVLIIGNWAYSQVCSIMLVKTTQYKSSGISSSNLLRALEIFDLPPAISPELNKCPGSNPVTNVVISSIFLVISQGQCFRVYFHTWKNMRLGCFLKVVLRGWYPPWNTSAPPGAPRSRTLSRPVSHIPLPFKNPTFSAKDVSF